MKVEIDYTGKLSVIMENKTESYALKQWITENKTSLDYLARANVFDVTDNFIDPEYKEGDESLLKHIQGVHNE